MAWRAERRDNQESPTLKPQWSPGSLKLPINTDMRRFNDGGYVLRNASLGDFVVARTS